MQVKPKRLGATDISETLDTFVKQGDAVTAGQVVGLIEAMKVFNEIKAEYPCTIVKYLVENGKPVKSGQDLIIVAR